MEDLEDFARIHLDTPVVTTGGDSAAGAAEAVPSRASSVQNSLRALSTRLKSFPLFRRDDSARRALEPAYGEVYRMLPLRSVLEALKIEAPADGYLEDDAVTALDVRLRRQGLALATAISGPLRLRIGDTVPVVDADTPLPSRYSSISISLYLIAWMLQADTHTERDIALTDRWISEFARKENWAETAKGTFLWLLSRKLILTRKRKQRTGRIRRFANVRNSLKGLLLSLVSDPHSATPKRMQRLRTIYETLGLDPAAIHSDLHNLSTNASGVSAAAGNSATSGHDSINTSRFKATAKNTRQAQQLLENVFSSAEEELFESLASDVAEKSGGTQGFSNTMAAIAAKLAAKEQWSRDEVADIASGQGLTAGALLEAINDFTFDAVGEPLAEDDGTTIYIDASISEELRELINE